ncbi:hypothetical protein FK220_018320 [Flavobacteriaceae bacterium TP-CH-4]|uniref:Uncharacterized protein n=1 Tax=Pelagihabitans pacificus TaxID=2696054 RepID=A0A967AY81_9FLAO|nr:hypothetical protein [Pelagihabitans pacificus]NHF61315.1 hypothetical protein [Pelagihabitans pacificus]
MKNSNLALPPKVLRALPQSYESLNLNRFKGMDILLRLRQQGLKVLPKLNFTLQGNKFEYRLKGFQNKFLRTDFTQEDTPCGIEIFKAGLLLKGDFPHRRNAISILSNEIESITLIRGKQIIDTFQLSPIHILSSLGASSCFARHFSLDPNEFQVEDTKILIKTTDQKLELTSCGHRFSRLSRAFRKSGYNDKLVMVKEPRYRIVDGLPEPVN